MASLPTGTVTFLFADIEGSTRLVQTAGGAYASVIADVRRLRRAEVAATGGTEVDATCDELSAAGRTGEGKRTSSVRISTMSSTLSGVATTLGR